MRSMDHTRRHLIAAALFATAATAWTLAGAVLPGGRWLAVHLLTLGVATNLLAGLMPHFARTVLKAPVEDTGATLRFALLNGGAILLLIGLPTRILAGVAVGATALTVGVLLLWRALRDARQRGLPSRFDFVARTYERACGAFVHGALLGAAMGLALVPGDWYAGVRLAHLHVNLLGWMGLPVLATLVTLGPTVLRTRMAEGAGPQAARWLPRAAAGLTVTVVALTLSGAPAPAGRLLEVIAAAGLTIYAAAVVAVCQPVLAVWRSGVRSLGGTLLASACAWFPIAIVADVLAIAIGRPTLLDAIAPALLVGVFVHAVLGSLLHLLPMAIPRTPDGRTALRTRLAALPVGWSVVLNTAVAVLTVLSAASRLTDVLPAVAVPTLWAVLVAMLLLLGASIGWACLVELDREGTPEEVLR